MAIDANQFMGGEGGGDNWGGNMMIFANKILADTSNFSTKSEGAWYTSPSLSGSCIVVGESVLRRQTSWRRKVAVDIPYRESYVTVDLVSGQGGYFIGAGFDPFSDLKGDFQVIIDGVIKGEFWTVTSDRSAAIGVQMYRDSDAYTVYSPVSAPMDSISSWTEEYLFEVRTLLPLYAMRFENSLTVRWARYRSTSGIKDNYGVNIKANYVLDSDIV